MDDGHGEHNQADEDAEFTSLHPLHNAAAAFIEVGKFLKEAELPHANDNGKAIDETNHHRMRHESDEPAQFQHSEEDLNAPCHHNNGKKKLKAKPIA